MGRVPRYPARASVLPLLFAACMTPAPPVRVAGALVTVHAESEHAARELARRADDAAAWIRSICPETRSSRPVIWRVEHIEPFRGFPFAEETDGLHFQFLCIDRIYLAQYAESGAETHELGHYLLGGDWRRLPPFLQEGLANWFHIHDPGVDGTLRGDLLSAIAALALGVDVLIELRPTTSPGLVQPRGLRGSFGFTSQLPGPEQVATRSKSALVFQPIAERLTAHAHGYVLVERVIARKGLTGLLDLCRRARQENRARVPLEWLYAAAGVADEHGLRHAVQAELSPGAFELALAHLAEALLDQLAQEHGFARQSPAFARWLGEVDPLLTLPENGLELRLLELDGLSGLLAPGIE
jgi:hypothetical protein